jgi:Trk K+ transport system NAD-binding subunit
MDSPLSSSPTTLSHILVCGLGSLGQHCIELLKEFGVQIRAIDQCVIEKWEILNLRNLLTEMVIGDCRQEDILKQAQIQNCRSILIVTSDERVNLETAFAARLLNPNIRIVIRSAKQNLNTLLEQQLGNFIALEPSLLSAPAFALAAMGQERRFYHPTDSAPMQEVLGFFRIEKIYYQIVKRQIQPQYRGCNILRLHELNTRFFRVLNHQAANLEYTPFTGFYHWDAETRIEAGDWLISIESSEKIAHLSNDSTSRTFNSQSTSGLKIQTLLSKKYLKAVFLSILEIIERSQFGRVGLFFGGAVITLLLLGMLLLYWYFPNMSLVDAFYTASILLLGGYGDLFGEFHLSITLPGWLRFLSLGLTLAGTAFIGVLYAVLTEKLISWRLQFLSRRLPLPKQNHIIVVGLGQVGQGVLEVLHDFKQHLVALSEAPLETNLVLKQPLLSGPVTETIKQANLATARSVVAVTADAMDNLELALMAHQTNPDCRLVLRTYDRPFTEKLAHLFPFANVLSVSALSSEAFVAATFGEKVLSLFRIDQQTILTTEYHIGEQDRLNRLILAEIAYGYGVIPILHQRPLQENPTLMPTDDVRIHSGDRLIVLSTTKGLWRIELGEMLPRRWQVYIEKAITSEAVFVGANEISRISGCELSTARSLMNHLPCFLPLLLYDHQAKRLV